MFSIALVHCFLLKIIRVPVISLAGNNISNIEGELTFCLRFIVGCNLKTGFVPFPSVMSFHFNIIIFFREPNFFYSTIQSQFTADTSCETTRVRQRKAKGTRVRFFFEYLLFCLNQRRASQVWNQFKINLLSHSLFFHEIFCLSRVLFISKRSMKTLIAIWRAPSPFSGLTSVGCVLNLFLQGTQIFFVDFLFVKFLFG